MIKSIIVTNHLGESIELELRAPEKSGLLIKDITGLGPSKANINVKELSTTDGSLYNSARLNSRNIVINLALLHDPTIEDARQKTYKYFPIKKQITLRIVTDNRVCETIGYVESNEPNIFTSSASTQISIICPDPFLYSADGDVITVLSGINPYFEFPFEITEPMVFGEMVLNHEQIVTYDGDGEVGVLFTIKAIGDATNLTLYNITANEKMRIDTAKLLTMTGSTIVEGDEIIISTYKGNKRAILLRDGLYTNILNALDKDADWLSLSKGENKFTFNAETGNSNLHITLAHRLVYEGV